MNGHDFFKKHDGEHIDFDGYYGFQCTDLVQKYGQEVVGSAPFHGNAVDFFTHFDTSKYIQVANSPENVPLFGDIVVWGKGLNIDGHCAIFDTGDVNRFQSFDQNWPIGSASHFQQHNYTNVLGWLRPTNQSVVDGNEPTPPQQPQPAPTPPVQPQGYTIKAGDTLTNICAQHYHITDPGSAYMKAVEIARINHIDNPNLIHVGQIIQLP